MIEREKKKKRDRPDWKLMLSVTEKIEREKKKKRDRPDWKLMLSVTEKIEQERKKNRDRKDSESRHCARKLYAHQKQQRKEWKE
jgi:thymidylate kinase